jgi:PAS domain S-box-containing protein
MTFRVQTKDGIVRWLYTRGAISASDGNSLHMHGASIDITARLQAESALRQSEQRFRALVDVSAAMVWTTNADGTNTEDSPSWRAFTGQTYEIWTSRGWLNAVHGDDRAQVESAWRRSLQTGTPLMSECRVYHAPSGEYRWTSVRAVPLEDSDGSVGGWVGMHIDISDLKETDRRKDEFLATLAHELRNPLAPLRTSLELLRSGKANSDLVANATRIMNRQLAHMVHLVDDLLDLTRISQGKIVLRKAPVPIATLIQSAIEAVRPAIDEQRCVLEVAWPSQPLYVDGDEIRLAQVISNLLSNAAKFSQSGGRIWVAVEGEGAEVVIRVRDEGIGIPDDRIRDIFQMFMQVDQSAERVRTGLGIGLSLAKQLVELHDGSISVRSEGRGKGSEFTVRLPSCPFVRPAAPIQVADALPNTSPTGLRVLIADDNRDAVETLADLLRMHGSEVAIAGDGAAALDTADAFRPEVVLLDIGMPKADGYEVCRRLRSRPATSSAIIIALSGWGQEEHRRKAKESGFDDYLVKPVEYAALVASLERLKRR